MLVKKIYFYIGVQVRILLLSSTTFGYKCLKSAILPIPGIKVTGIITTKKCINISYSNQPINISTYFEFTKIEKSINCYISVLSGKITKNKYLKAIDRCKPDLLLALGWYYIIPKVVRNAAPLGCVGIHASLLPKYRGGAPIVWAIINGEKETGVTLFHFDDGVDTGDIIAQKRYPILDNDNCKTIYDKATKASIEILKRSLPKLASGKAERIKQDESKATIYPQRKPDDGIIDWSWSAKRIKDFIRAQTKPYPGAFTVIKNKKVVIWDADLMPMD